MYDDTLDLGSIDLSGAVLIFPNTINLGKTEVNRKKIDILASANTAGGTGITATVQGSNDNATWTPVGANTFTAADLIKGGCAVLISTNSYQLLRVSITKTGTFTAGTVAAQLNTYLGK
jgi:hypothetical protein